MMFRELRHKTIEPLPLTGGTEAVYYFHGNHLGSANVITTPTALPVQFMLHLPYGEEFVKQLNSTYDERFTFTDKEKDIETGYYYFGARFDNVDLGFMSVDPMSDKYPSISPYAYCAWNPVKYVDPAGEEINPVYGSDGFFRACTKEGFTGRIIIFDGPVNFESLSMEELYCKYDEALPYDIAYTTMTDDAKSKMYTDIISHFEGDNILGTIFSMDELKDKKIYFDATKSGNWCTTRDENGKLGDDSRIYATDKYFSAYEPTVENIVSSVICHEWFSHKIQGCSDQTKNHQQAYTNVMNGPYWEKTTESYKSFVQTKFNKYAGR